MNPGERCRFTVAVHELPTTFEAVVHLVDGKGQPLAFLFDGIVEGFTGWLPVIWRNGEAQTFLGTLVEVEAR